MFRKVGIDLTRKDLDKFRTKLKKQYYKDSGQKLNFSFIDIVRNYPDCYYYMAIGERTGGKTYSALDYCFEQWKFEGKTFGYVRRFDTSLKRSFGQGVFKPFEVNGYISFITEGQYDSTVYKGREWYFAKTDPSTGEKIDIAPTPFCYALSLTNGENGKSVSYPTTDNLVFDEFISRERFYDNELPLLAQIMSTVFRSRKDVKIFMCGNSTNPYCPYFKEMGLTNIRKMNPGDIDVYSYGNTDLKVLVVRTEPDKEGKPNDFLFAFDNPQLKMITNSEWEIMAYPRLEIKYKTSEILKTFFIEYEDARLKCDIIEVDGGPVINIKPHTYEIKDPDELVYSSKVVARPNYSHNILRPRYPIEKKILKLFLEDKVFYATNYCGEVVRNYLQSCK